MSPSDSPNTRHTRAALGELFDYCAMRLAGDGAELGDGPVEALDHLADVLAARLESPVSALKVLDLTRAAAIVLEVGGHILSQQAAERLRAQCLEALPAGWVEAGGKVIILEDGVELTSVIEGPR